MAMMAVTDALYQISDPINPNIFSANFVMTQGQRPRLGAARYHRAEILNRLRKSYLFFLVILSRIFRSNWPHC